MRKFRIFVLSMVVFILLLSLNVCAATDWLSIGSSDYYKVQLDSSILKSSSKKYASVKIKTRNSNLKKESNTRVHIKITDINGNWLSEFDSKGGAKLNLGNDHSVYRVYLSYYKASGNWVDQANAFIDGGNDQWCLTSASKCSISSYKFSNNNKQTATVKKYDNTLYENVAYYLQPKHASNSVVDISGGVTSRSIGDNVLLWELGSNTYGKESRQFKFIHIANGWYKIQNVNSGLVLDVNCSNCNVTQWSYNGGDNQLWRLEDAGGGYYYIRAKVSDGNGTVYCLDVEGCNTSNGTNIIVYPQNGGNNQKFKLKRA